MEIKSSKDNKLGDQLNLLFIREPERLRHLANMHPVLLLPSKSAPEISNWVRLPSTAIISGLTWLEGGKIGNNTSNDDIQIVTESGTVFRQFGVEHDSVGIESVFGEDWWREILRAEPVVRRTESHECVHE